MGILQKAVTELKYRIPLHILNLAFNDYSEEGWRRAPVSIDEQILNKVIRPRVIMDTNIVAGETIMVPIEGLVPIYNDSYTRVVEIPPDRVNYRSIMSVLSAHYLPYGFSFNNLGQVSAVAGYGSANDIASAMQRVNNSFANVPMVSTAICQLVNYNTVLVRDKMYVSNIYSVRCVIANDENLENINPRSWHAFSRLCELATKSYIYNTLIVKIGQAYLLGGQELGIVSELISEYKEAEELYQVELRERWQKINFMNGTETYAAYIKMQLNPGI
jgi:hypothetical protein